MVELKEKTVEELRKMASRKKIEGRSKMNKAQLVRALQKCTTIKKRKMKGGALTEVQVADIIQNPQNYRFKYLHSPEKTIVNIREERDYLVISYQRNRDHISPETAFIKSTLRIMGHIEGEPDIIQYVDYHDQPRPGPPNKVIPQA